MNDHLIRKEASIREAFAALNKFSGKNMTLFVTDSQGLLTGSLTDGDLRRAVISGLGLDDAVGGACKKDCRRLDASLRGEARYRAVATAREAGISLLPVVSNGEVVDFLDLTRMKTALPIDAVLMAGGRGERLRPLTLDCPKPLLSVGQKAIIDYNVDELMANGIDRIWVTVNYLKEMIIEHFSNPRFSGKVKCVEEPTRLGTMGSLALCDGLSQDHVLVMNSDLLTTISFEKMYLHHIRSGADLTMAVIPYTVSVPFAIVRSEGNRVTGLTEKPTYNYFANAGVYMMRRQVALSIRKGQYLDAPVLIEQLIANHHRVEYYPIEGTWIDIGSPDDFRYANELMRVKN